MKFHLRSIATFMGLTVTAAVAFGNSGGAAGGSAAEPAMLDANSNPLNPAARSRDPVKPKKKPVSLSYESIIKCYPKLADDRMSFRVDLRMLGERISRVMAVQHSRMLERDVQYRDTDGVVRRLRLIDFKPITASPEYRVQADTIAENGEASPWTDSPLQGTVKSPWDVKSALIRADVLRDETLLREVLLGSMVVLTRKDMNRVLEITLSDFRETNRLHCEDRKDLGAVCTCQQKKK